MPTDDAAARVAPLTPEERQAIQQWVREDPHWPEQNTLVLLRRYEATLAAAEQARDQARAKLAEWQEEYRRRQTAVEIERDQARAERDAWSSAWDGLWEDYEAATERATDLAVQIDRLANFILQEIPGEPSQSEGAVDTAIRLLRRATDLSALEAAARLVDTCAVCNGHGVVYRAVDDGDVAGEPCDCRVALEEALQALAAAPADPT